MPVDRYVFDHGRSKTGPRYRFEKMERKIVRLTVAARFQIVVNPWLCRVGYGVAWESEKAVYLWRCALAYRPTVDSALKVTRVLIGWKRRRLCPAWRDRSENSRLRQLFLPSGVGRISWLRGRFVHARPAIRRRYLVGSPRKNAFPVFRNFLGHRFQTLQYVHHLEVWYSAFSFKTRKIELIPKAKDTGWKVGKRVKKRNEFWKKKKLAIFHLGTAMTLNQCVTWLL